MPTPRIARPLVLSSLCLLFALPTIGQELPKPGPEHREMAREAGVWDAEITSWMDPSAPPTKSTGTETCETFGGFFLTSHFESTFDGMPFQGQSQMTYDPEAGEYVSTWIDTMAPVVMISRGTYDAGTNTLTLLTGEHTCCMTGQRKVVKMITTYTDEDHKHFEIHEQVAGTDEWNKSMEIDYTRRK